MNTATRETQAPVAVTMGCPAGIGPEIICRFFGREDSSVSGLAVVVGDMAVLRQAAAGLGMVLPIESWLPGQPVKRGIVPVFQVGPHRTEPVCWGRPDAAGGRVMGQCIEEAVRLVDAKACSAIVTCPISKKSLQAAGYPYPGHTEMLASLTGSPRVRMMMAGPRLKVVLVTIHVALRQVPELLSPEEIADCIDMTRTSLQRDFALAAPRIAVAGLNPHGGENGLFGDEETRIIEPALAAFAADQVSGPWPPDTVFHKAAAGQYDAVIAMYHDQGLIPFKLLHFQDGVNVTLGLPLVRTSVDHGTAYDIAGKNMADPSSLVAALDLVQTIVANRRQGGDPCAPAC
ncbi:4-hydroxythreonine-4-phosphate dehydrogenase PdxA [Desulfobulbus sp.]|uniref:4-hydroxythreonine-4-phosphate dehydrogenase PdxA n=1 Tax=Desulfobulbus sp. TaxID=895 RepID=UPI00286F2ABF|nr:4-hydroxythreonine-4-phosphate dehydrogenase PdxA [Desulfobulbus sp.]